MTLLIGIDEAGYGPNLGPLCIGVTVWRVEDGVIDLYELLSKVVTSTPDNKRIAIADSKLLYRPGQGLALLERGVLPALAVVRAEAYTWRTLLMPPKLAWYVNYDSALPIDVIEEEVAGLASRLTIVCEAEGVQLCDMQVRLVFPQELNDLTTHYGTKGAALSHVTMVLLKQVLTLHSSLLAPTHIICDKHGGRNHYAALLQHHFPDERCEIIQESRPVSRYRWGTRKSRTEIVFRSKGEAELPVALASMAAKYHRELAMRAFNAFWGKHINGLKPTAGYPQDAKRFKADIAATQAKLGIDDCILWRNR